MIRINSKKIFSISSKYKQSYFLLLGMMAILIQGSCGSFVTSPTVDYTKGNNKSVKISDSYVIQDDGTKFFFNSKVYHNPIPIVICIHGLGAHTESFKYLMEYFEREKISYFAFDLRGFGHWDGDRGYVKNINIYLDDLNNIIELLKASHPNKKIILLGESMGSSISLWFGYHNSGKVDGLILTSLVDLNTNKNISLGKAIEFLFGYIFYPDKKISIPQDGSLISDDSEFINWMACCDKYGIHKISIRYLLQLNGIIKNTPLYLNKIDEPVLFLQGAMDSISDIESIKKNFAVTNRNHITFKEYKTGYHSLVNSTVRNELFKDISHWLEVNYR